jgi:hypothetical protein
MDARASTPTGEILTPLEPVTLFSMDNLHFRHIPPRALVIPGVNDSSAFLRPFGLVRTDHGVDFSTILNASLATGGTLSADLNRDGMIDARDIDLLVDDMWWVLDEGSLDLTGDRVVDLKDHRVWVEELAATYYGDADLDLEFNSSDLVLVFQVGQYEDDLPYNSKWNTGDWNADLELDSDDLTLAFQSGGYEQGRRPTGFAVPEPSGLLLLAGGVVAVIFHSIQRRAKGDAS